MDNEKSATNALESQTSSIGHPPSVRVKHDIKSAVTLNIWVERFKHVKGKILEGKIAKWVYRSLEKYFKRLDDCK